MATDHTRYDSPLCSRYASKAMQHLWGDQRKFSTWRRLWVELARAEMQLGLPVSELQVAELAAHVDDIDWELAAREERKRRHDVMAHVHTYGAACPIAAPIIHLGATSCYVTDNTDLILMREGLEMLARATARGRSSSEKLSRRMTSAAAESASSSPSKSSTSHSMRDVCGARALAAAIASPIPPHAAMWLSLIKTALARSSRWLCPPPQRTA